jgi:hypothetical protein
MRMKSIRSSSSQRVHAEAPGSGSQWESTWGNPVQVDVAEALRDAFGTWQLQKEAAESSGRPLSFENLIDDYVSDAHRKNPGAG